MHHSGITVIDLFAESGAVVEGLASVRDSKGRPVFNIRLCFEKDPVIYRTLLLRTIYRMLLAESGRVPAVYYRYIRQEINWEDFLHDGAVASVADAARRAVKPADIGELSEEELDGLIIEATGGGDCWILAGAPRCQPYSMAGRFRKTGRDASDDDANWLFLKYLNVIRRHRPAAFFYDHVVGSGPLISGGTENFRRLYESLSDPMDGLSYCIRPLNEGGWLGNVDSAPFKVCAEQYGVPQALHRIMLIGIREDLARHKRPSLRRRAEQVFVRAVLDGLPKVRSQLISESQSFETWHSVLGSTAVFLNNWSSPNRGVVGRYLESAIADSAGIRGLGGAFIEAAVRPAPEMPRDLATWLLDPCVGGVTQHQPRKMAEADLQRYVFATAYAQPYALSPKADAWPAGLKPSGFPDRYNVQVGVRPASRISSGIAKDPHHWIHPDAAQARSLTVREAARLQTFPDSYHFEGNAAKQFVQVGGATPPFLVMQIGEVIAGAIGISLQPGDSGERHI